MSDGDVERLVLRVPSMDCPSCATTVGEALNGVDGVVDHEVAPATGRVIFTYDGTETTREAAIEAVESAGYKIADADARPSRETFDPAGVWRSPRAVKTAAAAVLLAAGLVVAFTVDISLPALQGAYSVADALFLAAIAVGGMVILRAGYGSLLDRDLDIDFLMSAAILGATGITLIADENLLVEAASLAVLFNVAELLESYSVGRARASLAELVELSPETATVRRSGETTEVAVESVEEGERVVVEPGAKIPLDGVVVEGESAVDQSPVTGESVPVDKTVGDEVYAGTVNESGYLEVETTATAENNTIARIIDLVEGAESRKTDREQFVERFARYYTPVVVTAAVLTAVVPPLLLGGNWVEWVVRGIAFLVIACPCAFVISTPVTVVSGVTSAARSGVLVKGGDHLEATGEVDVIAFDKTGTLTTGDLEVTDVVPLHGNTREDVLACAGGLESRSEHPIAEAIVGEAGGPVEAPTVDVAGNGHGSNVSDFESLAGRGVRADLDGTTHYAGKPALFADLGFDLDHVHFTTETGDLPKETRERCEREDCLDLVDDTIPRLQADGKTVVLVGTEEELEGLIAVADSVRPEAELAIRALTERGVHTFMLTGDNEGTARAVADRVGVDEFRASLLPDEKVDAVEDLLADHEGVAFVGDGINDAPALATATVGVAMGAAGSDTAIETADVALLGDDLSKLPYLYELARRANRVIRQNIWGSLGVKGLLALGIPLGLVGVIHAVLIGDVGMTTAITGNATRLARLEPDDVL